MNISTTKGLAIIIVIAGLVAFFAMQQGNSLAPEQGAQPSVPTTSSGDDPIEDKSVESEDGIALIEELNNDAFCSSVHSHEARSDEAQIASRGPFALINGEPVGAVEVSGRVSSVEGMYFSDPITELYIAIDPPVEEDALEFYEYHAEMRKNGNSVNGLDGETLNFKLGKFDSDGAISSRADISDAARVVIIDLLNTQELANIRLRFAKSQGGGGAPEDFTFACAIEAVLASDKQVSEIGEIIPDGWKSYTDSRYGFTINYPEDGHMSGGKTIRGRRDCPGPPDFIPPPFPDRLQSPELLQNEICSWNVSGPGDGPALTITAWTNRADFDSAAYPAEYPSLREYMDIKEIAVGGVPATMRRMDWSKVPGASSGNVFIQVIIGESPAFAIGSNIGEHARFEEFYSSFRFTK